MERRRVSAVSNHEATLLPLILRDAAARLLRMRSDMVGKAKRARQIFGGPEEWWARREGAPLPTLRVSTYFFRISSTLYGPPPAVAR